MKPYLKLLLGTIIPLGIFAGTALSASARSVRIELLDVKCGNTEDVTGADEFYIVGALSDGTNTKAALTSPMDINDGQTKPFRADQRVIFDANVPNGVTVRGGLKAYDEDYAKDWSQYGSMVEKIAAGVAVGLTVAGYPTAGDILNYGVKGFGFFASLDKDDELGKLELNVAPLGPNVEEKTWRFRKTGSIWNPGWSTWDYTVRYRITRF
ncbi:MAG TPA: hypothetical protein V6D11_25180 [Waterburya sp.]|jgi:hypothetical protein